MVTSPFPCGHGSIILSCLADVLHVRQGLAEITVHALCGCSGGGDRAHSDHAVAMGWREALVCSLSASIPSHQHLSYSLACSSVKPGCMCMVLQLWIMEPAVHQAPRSP